MNGAGGRRKPSGHRLAGCLDNATLENVFRRHRRLLRGETVLRLADVAREELRISAQTSLRLAQTALALARLLDRPREEAFALRANANARWFLNENRAAVDLYGDAVRLFEKLGDAMEVARTLSSSIQPLIRLGEYNGALEGAERARRTFQESGNELRLARLELNVANILHRQDRFHEAFAAYERAYRQLAPLKDAEGIGAALHNMSVCLIALNDFSKALEVYEEARRFCGTHDMPALAAQADYNIAYLYYLRGDYSRGLEMLQAARRSAVASGDQYHVALCSMDESEIYLELNMQEEAADSARDAFAGFQQLGIGYESGKSLANLAIAQGRMGDTTAAVATLERARAIFVREGNPVWPSLLDLYQALMLFDADRLGESARLAAKALEVFGAHGLSSREILCRLLLARIALERGDAASARDGCRAALSLLEPLEAPHLRYQAHFLMGRIEEAAGEWEESRRFYETARAEAESARSLLRGEELKVAFMKGRYEIYERLVSLCLRGEPSGPALEEALYSMEQAKSRSLRDLLAARPGSGRWSGESESGARLGGIREELNWCYHRIEAEQTGEQIPSAARLAELERQARGLEKEFTAVLREMPAAEAENAGVAAAPVLPLSGIRQSLPADTVLIEYFRVGDRIVAMVVTPDGLHAVPLAEAARVREMAERLGFQLTKFRLGAEYIAACGSVLLEAVRSHLHGLYKALLAPLEPLLTGNHLLVVPHESLHHLPVHAFFDGERYVIDRFLVSYAPSATVHAVCQDRRPRREGPALVMGVPDPRAPLIEDEVRSVAGVVPGAELWIGEAANRTVLAERGAHCRLLHIATHGRFREDHPMFSAISLGDGYLNLYDLYRLSLPVDLAVLSGCSTGRNVVAEGDELLGLVRGLLHAGARSLLLTLWDVADQSTTWFMESFYRRLVAGEGKAEALRGAVLDLRAVLPHPYYWAPFFLIGAA